MLRRIRAWLNTVFLPTWANESFLAENKLLRSINKEQRQEIERLRAYIGGMELAIRAQRRITINNNNGGVNE